MAAGCAAAPTSSDGDPLDAGVDARGRRSGPGARSRRGHRAGRCRPARRWRCRAAPAGRRSRATWAFCATKVQVTRLLRLSHSSTSGHERRSASVSRPPGPLGWATAAGSGRHDGRARRLARAAPRADAGGGRSPRTRSVRRARAGRRRRAAARARSTGSGRGTRQRRGRRELPGRPRAPASGRLRGGRRRRGRQRGRSGGAAAGGAGAAYDTAAVGTPPTSRRRSSRSRRAAYPASPAAPGSRMRAAISSSCRRGEVAPVISVSAGVDDVGGARQRGRRRTRRPARASARAGPRARRAAPARRRRARPRRR